MSFAELAASARSTALATFGGTSVTVTDSDGGNSRTLTAIVHDSTEMRGDSALGLRDSKSKTFKFAGTVTGLALHDRISTGGKTYVVSRISQYPGELSCEAIAESEAYRLAPGASMK